MLQEQCWLPKPGCVKTRLAGRHSSSPTYKPSRSRNSLAQVECFVQICTNTINGTKTLHVGADVAIGQRCHGSKSAFLFWICRFATHSGKPLAKLEVKPNHESLHQLDATNQVPED